VDLRHGTAVDVQRIEYHEIAAIGRSVVGEADDLTHRRRSGRRRCRGADEGDLAGPVVVARVPVLLAVGGEVGGSRRPVLNLGRPVSTVEASYAWRCGR
jgi:hypothetical protein